ncbi:peptide MFS transporter [Microbacter margulisiae]|uniref:POT family proton-dependent oligopeptide transporter n=1 Tax=Microbacter margulisiae TaxID=1350067 RepID=A0A7W5H0X4_9PORP|nr:peptide MFS transporter [Microbacter margulisiae]MBB3186140.1 POT family proton-dependent oligopeptide transporter [Microbacter margulisiae]
MLKDHPKGLIPLALANTGERFGFYTMLAIFVLYLQAKFGFDKGTTSTIYGVFMGAVYFMPLIGGFVADKWFGYGKTILVGIIIMFFGYLLLAIPNNNLHFSLIAMIGALTLITIGTGLFKGNLQVLVGNLYDDPQYSSKRDVAFSIFYMCINIGAFFAPSTAEWITNFSLQNHQLTYQAQIPALAHQFLSGNITPSGLQDLKNLAEAQLIGASNHLVDFSHLYIQRLSDAYNYGFAVACFSLILSIAIFLVFKKTYKHADYNANQPNTINNHIEELTPKQTKDRIMALLLVFAVVIFFWMSFQQNGLTMTFFARDYTVSSVSGFTRIGFSLTSLTLIIVLFYSILNAVQSKNGRTRIISSVMGLGALAGTIFVYKALPAEMHLTPQIFQQFNPFFIIILTPIFVTLFSTLNKRGKEPSSPRKISIGMVIAAIGFTILVIGSFGLMSPAQLQASGGVSQTLVSPDWLIGTYLTLTFAELFLSPMGISFVSRVAPPKYKGLMMGGWFVATAVGNALTAVIGNLWSTLPVWVVWSILVACCVISALFMFSILKKLEMVTQ